ncbi:MAG: HNH endonuclease [Chloroflexi bacterium]|nr:HNH endonuclease [Chloroflexota bacterium]
MRRTSVPSQLKREVLLEAGHRCAIPTCRQTTLEITHIAPWSKVKEHEFANLIALCPTCHARYHKGEIDRQSMLSYKRNLSILNSRYTDIERRVLDFFASQPEAQYIKLPGGVVIWLWYLIKDGYLVLDGHSSGHKEDEFPNYDLYYLTPAGRELVQKWISAEPIE